LAVRNMLNARRQSTVGTPPRANAAVGGQIIALCETLMTRVPEARQGTHRHAGNIKM
jgi:hypothetical protein